MRYSVTDYDVELKHEYLQKKLHVVIQGEEQQIKEIMQ